MLHHMKKAEIKLSDHGKINVMVRDQPLPKMQWYFKGFREGTMPAALYKRYGLKNNFDLEHKAYSSLVLEVSPAE